MRNKNNISFHFFSNACHSMKVEAVLTLPEAAALSTLELKSSQETEEVAILYFTTIYIRATFFYIFLLLPRLS